MSKQNLRKWKEKTGDVRAINGRRGSDADWNIANPGQRRDPGNYYGPHYQNLIKGRAETYSHTIEPKLPDTWVKRPHPYPEHVRAEHDAYHAYNDENGRISKEHAALNMYNVRKRDPEYQTKLAKSIALTEAGRRAATMEAFSRTAFDNKLPTGYESLEAKVSHKRAVATSLTSSRNWKATKQKELARASKLGH